MAKNSRQTVLNRGSEIAVGKPSHHPSSTNITNEGAEILQPLHFFLSSGTEVKASLSFHRSKTYAKQQSFPAINPETA
jgi:hypothetical protein